MTETQKQIWIATYAAAFAMKMKDNSTQHLKAEWFEMLAKESVEIAERAVWHLPPEARSRVMV